MSCCRGDSWSAEEGGGVKTLALGFAMAPQRLRVLVNDFLIDGKFGDTYGLTSLQQNLYYDTSSSERLKNMFFIDSIKNVK